ncbi:hypothetical protein DOTSEDRAFT_38893 [Dothistroma septosporum NZE10]|uniref:Uncharacterized protein n=1 Tax=Dothistroma septosporum (strain NZE10 / CBS 128990) TaxID=675120 RepID=M2YI97_DOTSN|nr:hypothetical protein DOTSEDRAFT_38893 [Dothistroma septosporum NZE10]
MSWFTPWPRTLRKLHRMKHVLQIRQGPDAIDQQETLADSLACDVTERRLLAYGQDGSYCSGNSSEGSSRPADMVRATFAPADSAQAATRREASSHVGVRGDSCKQAIKAWSSHESSEPRLDDQKPVVSASESVKLPSVLWNEEHQCLAFCKDWIELKRTKSAGYCTSYGVAKDNGNVAGWLVHARLQHD